MRDAADVTLRDVRLSFAANDDRPAILLTVLGTATASSGNLCTATTLILYIFMLMVVQLFAQQLLLMGIQGVLSARARL